MTIDVSDVSARRTRLTHRVSFLLLLSLAVFPVLPAGASVWMPQSASAKAKQDYALIYGTVWGPDGRRVPGVPVKIRRASDKKAKWDLVSDNSGDFAQRVPVGTQDYVIEAEIKVPKGQPKPQITVHIDDFNPMFLK